MAVLRIADLPSAPLDAAAAFTAHWLVPARAMLAQGAPLLVLEFAAADHTHRSWRLAMVQELAREAVPARVNAVASDSAQAVAAAVSYLERAEGVTGQYLVLDDAGAGAVLPSPA